MKKLLELLLNRVVIVFILLVVQVVLLAVALIRFNEYFVYFYVLSAAINFIILMRIINSRRNPAYKLAWVIVVLLDPIIGVLLYLLFGHVRESKKKRLRKEQVIQKAFHAGSSFKAIPAKSLQEINPIAYKQSIYLEQRAHSPLYQNTDTVYFPLGEDMFERMKEEMRNAKEYIFFEYFIINQGYMWDSILEILVQKAKEGLDVRVVYDDLSGSFTLPRKYDKTLEKMGIKCGIFRPFIPLLSSHLNNRTHRKCTVIDGIIAFTGGVNISDEYINHIEVFGHWKDTAVMMKGDAAWGFAVQFLSIWDYIRGEDKPYDFYRPTQIYQASCNGYAQPHADDPLEDERVSSTVYLNMIAAAQRYLYVYTPYLVIDNETLIAFCNAAKSGVDVRIMTPHIRDKWFVHPVSQSHYQQLIESGVRVYEYTPGFIHAKSFVCDDKYAVIGTVNLDYRSLYLHLECGVWLYETQAVAAAHDDFIATQQVSQQITLEECLNVPAIKKLGRSILRLFAPLM